MSGFFWLKTLLLFHSGFNLGFQSSMKIFVLQFFRLREGFCPCCNAKSLISSFPATKSSLINEMNLLTVQS